MKPKQLLVVEQHLALLGDGMKGTPLKCLGEIMEMAQLGRCPDCNGEGRSLRNFRATMSEQEAIDALEECDRCQGRGMVKKEGE